MIIQDELNGYESYLRIKALYAKRAEDAKASKTKNKDVIVKHLGDKKSISPTCNEERIKRHHSEETKKKMHHPHKPAYGKRSGRKGCLGAHWHLSEETLRHREQLRALKRSKKENYRNIKSVSPTTGQSLHEFLLSIV